LRETGCFAAAERGAGFGDTFLEAVFVYFLGRRVRMWEERGV
jgi:hypothetical protein